MKISLCFIVIVTALTTASCRRNLTCECSTTITTVQTTGTNSNTSSSTIQTTISKNKQKKKDFRMQESCYPTITTSTVITGNTNEVITKDKRCVIK